MITPDMQLLDIVHTWPDTEAVFHRFDEILGVCLLCYHLFDTLEGVCQTWQLDETELIKELNEAIAGDR